MRQFCLFTYPPRSKWALSEKMIFFLPKSASSVSRPQAHLPKRCLSVYTTIFVRRKDKTNYRSNQTWAKCYHSQKRKSWKKKTLDSGPYIIWVQVEKDAIEATFMNILFFIIIYFISLLFIIDCVHLYFTILYVNIYPPRSKWASCENMIFLPKSASSVSRSQAHLAKRCSSVYTTIFVRQKNKTNYLSNQTWAKCYHTRNKH